MKNEFQQQHDIIICQAFRLLQKTFQHTATSTEPVRPFLSGKLLQLVLQCLFIIDGFPQFLFAFSNSRLSFSSFEVSGKGSVLLSRYQHINPVWFSNALTHPHDKSGGFQFIQRTLDRHGAAGQDCGNGCDGEADKQDSVLVLLPFDSIASSIRQYMTFAVLLTGNPVNALGNGIQGGNGVSIVINSKFIRCVPPFLCSFDK